MQSRKGNLLEERTVNGPRVNWEEIFTNPDRIFTLGGDEYSNAASLRSSGGSYANRHGFEGVLHVIEATDSTGIEVQFEPRSSTKS